MNSLSTAALNASWTSSLNAPKLAGASKPGVGSTTLGGQTVGGVAVVVAGAAVVVAGAAVVVGVAVVVADGSLVVVVLGAAVSELPPQADTTNKTVTNTPMRLSLPQFT